MKKVNSVKKEFPHIYIILLSLIFLSFLLTFIIPSGKYNKSIVEGKEVIDPASFSYIEKHTLNVMDLFTALHKGLVDTAPIIFFIFIVGGSIGVLEDTKAIEAALKHLTKKIGKKGLLSIPIIMLFFGLGGATFGMAEETLPFIPIVASLMVSLGFDTVTGVMVVLCGAGAGFSAALTNPFTIGIAQGIAGLPLFSGLPFRILMFIVFEIVTISFVLLYARKIKEGKITPIISFQEGKSSLQEGKGSLQEGKEASAEGSEEEPFLGRHKVILALFLLSLVVLIVGVIKFNWYMQEISALFLFLSIIVAIVGRMKINEYARSFERNMTRITAGALIVGFAKAVPLILQEGAILETMLRAAQVVLNKAPKSFTALGMYLVQCLLNFALPSGGGQAAVSMPIMAPLAQMTGVTRQTAVIAFQMGDGISNIFFPTSGYFMAGLALAGVKWETWARRVLPLIALQYAIGAIFVLISWGIKLGPF